MATEKDREVKDADIGNPATAVRSAPHSMRSENREGEAEAAEANRVAREVEENMGGPALFGPAARAELPPEFDDSHLIATGIAIHQTAARRLPFPGNWIVDHVTKIREVRSGTNEHGVGFREWRVRSIAAGEPIPFNAEAVPDNMPEHDWLPVL